jgi:hypothetical protein
MFFQNNVFFFIKKIFTTYRQNYEFHLYSSEGSIPSTVILDRNTLMSKVLDITLDCKSLNVDMEVNKRG